ncbi:hypothetical protein J3D47_002917 [Pseudomonas laurylsulfativorans]|uniref:hypothetical protein n=1 Tax=Pseudomonas laurylsulfativorans TaxID=1943631 RepID=UPI00209CD6FA|nr:hypothetical protein [Pseudomonas laurylsulfativorans]MCP1418674.1 hypothetical protein [Pseudomonas laurylsulfativorans]
MSLEEKKTVAVAESDLLRFCYGADHTLALKAETNSPWVKQGVKLDNDRNLPTLPFNSIPSAGDYQVFEEDGTSWVINCPRAAANAAAQPFQMWFQTEFTSPPYKMDGSLGHHRVSYDNIRGNERFQVIEYQETTTLSAREVSYYDRQLPLPFEVKWILEGKELDSTLPDIDGMVSLPFTTTVPGNHTITLQVPSLYYEGGYTLEDVVVHALAKTPWNNNAKLMLNNQPVAGLASLGLIFTRGKTHSLQIVNDDLLLDESILTLDSASDLSSLGITVPDLTIGKPLNGPMMDWQINSSSTASRSGYFEFTMACSKLKKDWEIAARIISENLSDEVKSIEVRDRPISDVGALFFTGETAVLRLTFEPWMRGLAVKLKQIGDPNDVTYEPQLNVSRAVPDSLALEWKVTGNTLTSFTLEASCEHTTTALTFSSRIISKISAEQFKSIKINDVGIGDLHNPSLTFFRGDSFVLELEALPGGSLPGMKVALVSGDLYPDLDMSYNPPLGAEHTQIIPTTPTGALPKWTITTGNKSGFFDLQFKFTETDELFPLPCRVLSRNLLDEAVVKIGGIAIPASGTLFFRDQPQKLTLEPNPGSPLSKHPVTLTCSVKSGLDAEDVMSNPGFNSPQTAHEWNITGKTRSGTFQLTLNGQGMSPPILLPTSKLMSKDLNDEADVKINGMDVTALGHMFIKGQSQEVTLVPKAHSPLRDFAIALLCTPKGAVLPQDVVSEPEFGKETTDYQWTVKASTHSGLFDLHFENPAFTQLDVLGRVRSANIVEEFKAMEVSGGGVPTYECNFSDTGLLMPGPASQLASKQIKLTTFPDGPLVGLNMKLTWVSGDVGLAPDFIMPGLGIDTAIGQGGASWAWNRTHGIKEGLFQLKAQCDNSEFNVPGAVFSQHPADLLDHMYYNNQDIEYKYQHQRPLSVYPRDGSTPVRVTIHKNSPLFKWISTWGNQFKISLSSNAASHRVTMTPPSGSQITLNPAGDEFTFTLMKDPGYNFGGNFTVNIRFPYGIYTAEINCRAELP